ncbi:MAG: hypothetical protein MHPSP_004937, partial [Paramarteilia canceri]
EIEQKIKAQFFDSFFTDISQEGNFKIVEVVGDPCILEKLNELIAKSECTYE